MTTRLTPEHRRAQIIAAAHTLSAEGGLYDWTLMNVAEVVGITLAGVRRYYTSAHTLRRTVIREAVSAADVDIVTQALAKYDPIVANIPDDLRKACARSMAR